MKTPARAQELSAWPVLSRWINTRQHLASCEQHSAEDSNFWNLKMIFSRLTTLSLLVFGLLGMGSAHAFNNLCQAPTHNWQEVKSGKGKPPSHVIYCSGNMVRVTECQKMNNPNLPKKCGQVTKCADKNDVLMTVPGAVNHDCVWKGIVEPCGPGGHPNCKKK